MGFDRRGSFSFQGGGFGQNVLLFEVDMSFSTHIDNQKKDILVLGIGPHFSVRKRIRTYFNCKKNVVN